MVNVSVEDVRKLRDITGLSLMECKRTLLLFDNSFDQALELIKMYYIEKRPDRKHWIYEDYIDYIRKNHSDKE